MEVHAWQQNDLAGFGADCDLVIICQQHICSYKHLDCNL